MRYRVALQSQRQPAFLVTCNGVVIHATYQLRWCLGHDFEAINRTLTTLNATWRVISTRIDKPRHSDWLDYDGEADASVIDE